ncbi:helix-turn-helix transcriptional regulator, partial [Candidatus Bipolaricaulota bacterium]|nr:helix-turn-helix transcriptional regulator [Candidatus Bipolaricaulota bacterium]
LDAALPDSNLLALALAHFPKDQARRWYLLVPGVAEHWCEGLLPATVRIFNRERTTATQIANAVLKDLEHEGKHHIWTIRYIPEVNGIAVQLGTGKSYLLMLPDLPEADPSAVTSVEIGKDDSYFVVRQTSGNWFEVPWDDVLYHCEPSYKYYKGKQPANESDNQRIGTRLRQARKAKGLTVTELARLTDMKRPNLSRLEHGKHRPSLETLERLAEALGIPVASLVSR